MKAYLLIAGIVMLLCSVARLQTSGVGLQAGHNLDTTSRRVQQYLKREALKLNLETLSESKSEDEFRLWVGFGLITPRCFKWKRERGSEKAMYYATTSERIAETPSPKYRVTQLATALPPPQSGWEDFQEFLKSKGVDSPIKLTSDLNSAPNPDEELLVLELKARGIYNIAFFPTSSRSADGLKAMDVCHEIESEFKIRLGC